MESDPAGAALLRSPHAALPLVAEPYARASVGQEARYRHVNASPRRESQEEAREIRPLSLKSASPCVVSLVQRTVWLCEAAHAVTALDIFVRLLFPFAHRSDSRIPIKRLT